MLCVKDTKRKSPGNVDREGVRHSLRPLQDPGRGERAGLETRVFGDLSLGTHRKEMAVFKGQDDIVSFSNYVSPVFTDLFAEEEKMISIQRAKIQAFYGFGG